MIALEREAFLHESEFDVVTDAARCAFLSTLRSPFDESLADTSVSPSIEERPRRQRTPDSGMECERSLEFNTRARRVHQILKAPAAGRVLDASYDGSSRGSGSGNGMRSPHKFFPRFKAFFTCFGLGDSCDTPGRKGPKGRHRCSESGNLCPERVPVHVWPTRMTVVVL